MGVRGVWEPDFIALKNRGFLHITPIAGSQWEVLSSIRFLPEHQEIKG